MQTARAVLSLSLAVAFTGGCGQSTTASDASSTDTAMRDSSLGSDAFIGGDAGVVCSGHDASAFPTFARGCTVDGDCAIGAHQTDCCGTISAMGIAGSERARFAAAESQCESQYPACGCASGTVRTDDGSTPPPGSGANAVVVHCAAGQCTTSARTSTSCGTATCTPTQVCVMECSGIPRPDGGTPLPSHCVEVPAACAGRTDCACFGTTNPCPTGTCQSVQNGQPLCLCA